MSPENTTGPPAVSILNNGRPNRAAEVLLQRDRVTVSREFVFTSEIIEFLDRTTWGTQETLYQHKNTSERLANLVDPILAVLRIDGELVAMVVVDRRKVRHGDLVTDSYFFRYYASATDVSFRNRRIVGLYSREFMNLIRKDDPNKSVYYASVEQKNHRSLNAIIKMGYQVVATIKTIAFSRFFLKTHTQVKVANKEDLGTMRQLLQERYKDHALYHDSYIGHNDQYYIWKEEGIILAGIQVHRAQWVIEKLPGPMGGILVKIAGYLPLFNRVFNPKKFEFLAIEGLYLRPGNEDVLIPLLEGVLASEKIHSAILWLDNRSPDYDLVSRQKRLGLLNGFTSEAQTLIVTSYRNLQPTEETRIGDYPIYISCFDFI